LGDLASKFNTTIAAECYVNQKHSEAGIIDTLFNKSTGHFLTGYKDKSNVQSFYDVKTVEMLFPLLLESTSSEQVSSIVSYLTDENHFWTAYPVPSVSKAEAEYNPVFNTDLLWRGPSWGFTNWFIMEGLQKKGQTAILNEMMDRWISMVKKGGIYEMYNPETAVGYGAEGLGMSTLIVDWMKRLGRI
jgi:glycogen debranching enzyme